jgi:mannose-1-phosphate guanylyltransferase
MKAVILAGGLGTRLQPYTFFIPKPMLPIGNKPLLEHILEWLKKINGINEIIICVSYLHRIIEDYFEDGGRFGLKIQYARSERPLATAGQLKSAEHFLNETFLCLYGDSIYDFNLEKMIHEHIQSKALVSMALLSYKTNLKYGFIDVRGKEDRIISWREKPEVRGLINIGCYVIEPPFLNIIPRLSAFGMDDAVRKALEKKNLIKGFRIGSSGFIDIGDKKSYLEVYKKYVRKLGKI